MNPIWLIMKITFKEGIRSRILYGITVLAILLFASNVVITNLFSLEVGKVMDLAILDAPSRVHLAYHFGVNIVDTVVKAGKVVVSGGCRA